MPSVSMEGIRKYYPSSGVLANDGASLRVEEGEIHALVGENGAGKSTLMRILYGLEPADEGRIRVGGQDLRIGHQSAARRLGLGMVQQHFTTVPDFSVAENVILGDEPRRLGLFIDRAAAEGAVAAIARENGFGLDPRALASGLSIGERQELEIVKLLYRRARLLILDEPTAVLTEQEVESFFATLRRLRDLGKTIIIITHKVREVMSVADSVTVMRRGRTVARLKIEQVDEAGLSCLMMGRPSCGEGAQGQLGPRAPAGGASGLEGAAPVFEMRSVCVRKRPHSPSLMDGVSLSVRPGEILGVTGVVGNGLGLFENLVSGFARPDSGEILLSGSPRPGLRKPGLSYVPADRIKRGASLDSSVEENLAALDRGRYFPRGFLDARRMREDAMRAIGDFSIDAGPEGRMGSLSGGNMQKVILARELRGDSSFLFFSNPSWGLDIASAEFVHREILAARSRGAAILLVSANLDEILALADRVSVMYRGRLVCSLPNGPGLDRIGLGEYMLGLRDDTRCDDTRRDDPRREDMRREDTHREAAK
jgi:simple sugar transport system ATP-binding protein